MHGSRLTPRPPGVRHTCHRTRRATGTRPACTPSAVPVRGRPASCRTLPAFSRTRSVLHRTPRRTRRDTCRARCTPALAGTPRMPSAAPATPSVTPHWTRRATSNAHHLLYPARPLSRLARQPPHPPSRPPLATPSGFAGPGRPSAVHTACCTRRQAAASCHALHVSHSTSRALRLTPHWTRRATSHAHHLLYPARPLSRPARQPPRPSSPPPHSQALPDPALHRPCTPPAVLGASRHALHANRRTRAALRYTRVHRTDRLPSRSGRSLPDLARHPPYDRHLVLQHVTCRTRSGQPAGCSAR
jgi:hypothetical protein